MCFLGVVAVYRITKLDGSEDIREELERRVINKRKQKIRRKNKVI
jgi:hypothetical protein